MVQWPLIKGWRCHPRCPLPTPFYWFLNHTLEEKNGTFLWHGCAWLYTRICRFFWARIAHRWRGSNTQPTSQFQLWTRRVSGTSTFRIYDTHLIIFQGWGTLFKVIKNGFQVSGTIFEAMFALPLGGEAPVEGTSLETPIVLEGVDEHHF